MTTPEVHEINDPGEPIGPEGTAGMPAHFEDIKDRNQLPHNKIRAARLAGLQALRLQALQNADVAVVRKEDIEKIQSDAAVNAANAIPKEKMH
jgi:hypothetical protein